MCTVGMMTNADPESKINRNLILSHELANDLTKGKKNYPSHVVEAMQLAQMYRSEGRVIGDVVRSAKEIDETTYVTKPYKSNN